MRLDKINWEIERWEVIEFIELRIFIADCDRVKPKA